MPETTASSAAASPLTPAIGRGRLLQVLGVSLGIAVIIGNTILIGILRTPGGVAERLPSPALFVGVWIIGGLYALLGTLSLAEPGAMVAQSGGQYVIVRRGLGAYPGFVVGWSDWISTCGTIALGAMVITEYLEPLVPAMARLRVPVGVGLVLVFGLFLWRGIRIGDLSQQILSARKEPETPRPYRVPGFPFTTGLALVASVAFLVGSVITDWGNSWKSLVLLAVSYPVYRAIMARQRA